MSEKSDKPDKGDKSSWTGKAALAGAAIGSAALAGALLFASRRKERIDKAKANPKPIDPPETD
jgi:LPXTG-motif cell wall-anchored protein